VREVQPARDHLREIKARPVWRLGIYRPRRPPIRSSESEPVARATTGGRAASSATARETKQTDEARPRSNIFRMRRRGGAGRRAALTVATKTMADGGRRGKDAKSGGAVWRVERLKSLGDAPPDGRAALPAKGRPGRPQLYLPILAIVTACRGTRGVSAAHGDHGKGRPRSSRSSCDVSSRKLLLR
jgi:hypothetical protein